MKEKKTNAIRILESKGLSFVSHEYDENITDGVLVAEALNAERERVFKTLVTEGSDLQHYVFVIPVGQTLSLKKAAKCVGVKSVSMLKQKDLFPLTGYIHGGCSPLGMKKQFRTVFDETVILYDSIYFSAGRRGMNVECESRVVSEFGFEVGDLVE